LAESLQPANQNQLINDELGNSLVLDGGFVVPEKNAFGHEFRFDHCGPHTVDVFFIMFGFPYTISV